MSGSLAYRRNEARIWNGQVPTKYLRLMPYITGQRILEIGAAEGVQSLLLADRDPLARVTALELTEARHLKALALQHRWRDLGKSVDGCTMVSGDIRDHLALLDGQETFVAVRTIYHLGAFVTALADAIARSSIRSMVLAGNPNRARWAATHTIPETDSAGVFNRYAGIEGMVSVIEAAGFTPGAIVKEGDPIVTGSR